MSASVNFTVTKKYHCDVLVTGGGVAAAMAAEGQCGVRDIDVTELRKKLISGDVILETSGS